MIPFLALVSVLTLIFLVENASFKAYDPTSREVLEAFRRKRLSGRKSYRFPYGHNEAKINASGK